MIKKFKFGLVILLMSGFFASGLFIPGNDGGSLAYAQRSADDREKRRELRREERRKRQEAKKEARKKRREARKERKKRKRWCRRNPDKCKPPTVSELPVHTMVGSGVAAILIAGGVVYQLRRREEENASNL